MAFTFVVEDGTGLPNANSYVTVAEADDILVTNIHNEAWPALDTPSKEKLLAWATSIIDLKADWNGVKTYPSSSLRWPRKYVIGRDFYPIPSNEIPLQLKQAVAQYANFLMSNDVTAQSETAGITEIVVDVIELKFDSSFTKSTIPNFLSDLLYGLGTISNGKLTVAKIKRS